MKVVDLRNVFASCSDTLVEVNDHYIYYAEEKQEEGHNNLFLLEYNRDTRRERIISDYFLNSPAFVQHYFSFPDDILIVMESGESEAWILRVDKHTGGEKNLVRLNLIGTFEDCKALDESHVIFYTTENERHRRLFQEYKKRTGFARVVYLAAACVFVPLQLVNSGIGNISLPVFASLGLSLFLIADAWLTKKIHRRRRLRP